MARKSKYNPETFPLLAEKYAREGMIDKEIAKCLGIVLSTFYDYQKKYSEFSNAIKEGKAPVNFMVEKALLKRAQGYTYEETTKVMTLDKKGSPEVKEIRKVTKEVIPSVAAQEFWLKNREPDKWRDKTEVEHSGDVVENHKITYSDLNDD